MEHVNDLFFLAINAGPHPSGLLLATARLFANWLVPLGALLFVLLWIRTPGPERGVLVTATLTMLIGLAANQAIGIVYFHPRPFMIGLGHQYLVHPPDNSFPSDHATFLWSLGFALLALGVLRAWTVLLLVAGLGVAWARIYVGVHFPLDMAGSLLVALAVTRFAKALHGWVQPWLLPSCVRLYEALIRLCRLPPLLFPRQAMPAVVHRRRMNPNWRPGRR